MTWSEGRNCEHFIPDQLYGEYRQDFPPKFRKHIKKAVERHRGPLEQIASEVAPDPPQNGSSDLCKDLYKTCGSYVINSARERNGFESIDRLIHESEYMNREGITEDQVQEYMGMKILGNGSN